ncbi:MAG: hypothetical protein JWP58_1067 [Hymenobacter sp.]|nr:hypothetical protein [Hymenobacter sp.]
MCTLVNALIVYTSEPASPQMATFLMAAAQGQHLDIRPTSALPPPDLQRRQALRTERLELEEAISLAVAELACFASGEAQPDAGRENGLRFDLDARRRRLAGIMTVLGTEIGGPDNG